MWPIGPEPFITTDTYYYYRSLSRVCSESKVPRSPDVGRDVSGNARVYGSLGLLAYRLAWMFIGPMTAMVAALLILTSGSGWLTKFDLTYLIAVAVTIGARWAGYLSGDVTDDDGHPTTSPSTLRSYTLRITSVALALWLVTNVLGNHLFN